MTTDHPPRRSPRPPQGTSGGAAATFLDLTADESHRDRRRLRLALATAAAAHLAFFAVDFPEVAAQTLEPAAKPKVYVIEQVRFRPPPPPPEDLRPQQARTVPIPDPTPDDPEPIRTYEEVASDDLDLPVPELAYIPDAPPAPPVSDDPIPVGGEVTPPVKVSGPDPVYTEAARRARIEGTVIVRATIDREGGVTGLEVLRALPLGLADSAVDAVRQWRFSPGTLHGEPVPVLYVLTVHFQLQ